MRPVSPSKPPVMHATPQKTYNGNKASRRYSTPLYGARMNIATTRSRKTVKGAITYRIIGNGDKCSKVWKSETIRPKTYLLAEKALDMYGRILDIGEITSVVWAPSPCADDAVSTMFNSVDDMVAVVWRKGWRRRQENMVM